MKGSILKYFIINLLESCLITLKYFGKKKKNESVLISQLNPVRVFRESTLTIARGL